MSRARRPVKRSRPGDERLPTSWEWLPPGVERREHRSAARQAQPAQSAQSPALIAPAGVAAALNPRCPHPGIAVPGGLLGVAVGRLDRVVDIDERQHLGAALCVASRARKRAATASSWRTWPKVNVRRTSRASMAPEPPSNSRPIRPCRSRPSPRPSRRPAPTPSAARSPRPGPGWSGAGRPGPRARSAGERDDRRPATRHQVGVVGHRRLDLADAHLTGRESRQSRSDRSATDTHLIRVITNDEGTPLLATTRRPASRA